MLRNHLYRSQEGSRFNSRLISSCVALGFGITLCQAC